MEQAQPLHSADKMGKRTCFFWVRGLRNSDPGNPGFRPASEWSWGFILIGQGCRSWGGRGAWDRAGARLSCRDDGLSHLLTALLRTQPLRGHFTAPEAFVDLATLLSLVPQCWGKLSGQRELRGRRLGLYEGMQSLCSRNILWGTMQSLPRAL